MILIMIEIIIMLMMITFNLIFYFTIAWNNIII